MFPLIPLALASLIAFRAPAQPSAAAGRVFEACADVLAVTPAYLYAVEGHGRRALVIGTRTADMPVDKLPWFAKALIRDARVLVSTAPPRFIDPTDETNDPDLNRERGLRFAYLDRLGPRAAVLKQRFKESGLSGDVAEHMNLPTLVASLQFALGDHVTDLSANEMARARRLYKVIGKLDPEVSIPDMLEFEAATDLARGVARLAANARALPDLDEPAEVAAMTAERLSHDHVLYLLQTIELAAKARIKGPSLRGGGPEAFADLNFRVLALSPEHLFRAIVRGKRIADRARAAILAHDGLLLAVDVHNLEGPIGVIEHLRRRGFDVRRITEADHWSWEAP